MKKGAVIVFGTILCILFSSLTAWAGTVVLPKTGQTKCYNAAGTEIAYSGTGQDGEIQAGVVWPNPRFTAGTGAEADCMIDNLTGLMWPKNGNLAGGTKIWNDAIDYANNLALCGYSDWRLPNINELESLVNEGQSNPASWLNAQGLTNVQSSYYWSSSTYAGNTGYAWYVGMNYGGGSYGEKSGSIYVWPVRGQSGSSAIWRTGQTTSYRSGDDGDLKLGVSWPSPRFTDDANGKVTDNLTGVVWTKDANAPGPACSPATTKTWQGALDYVKCLNIQNHLGHNDWRLPNINELESLVDYTKYQPVLPSGHPFTNVQSGFYWSSSTLAGSTTRGWGIFMDSGIVNHYVKSDIYYVWPVRGGQVGNSVNLVISKSGTGNGTITGTDINCTSECSAWFSQAASVTLTAAADASSTFTGWSGACSGTSATCTLTMDASRNVTAAFSPDTTAPTGTITINSGTAYTNTTAVTLTLSCADTNACSQMQFSNDNIDWSAAAVAYATSKSYSLPSGDGTKTVYVKFKDTAGNWSSAYSYSAILDTTLPIGGAQVALPKTGQTKCYNTAGTEITCSSTGQDGEIQAGAAWPNPRFTAGTGAAADCMIDNLTGLMWPKNGNLANGTKIWNDAIDYANNLTLCGYDDWRLPNVNELESLFNAGQSDQAVWLNAQSFTNVQSGSYWSSSTYAGGTGYAWSVSMGGDYVGGYTNYNSKGSTFYVWPVRSGQGGPLGSSVIWRTGQTTSYRSGDDGDLKIGVTWPSPRFTDHANGKVTDNLTGIVWTKDANAPGPSACSPGITKTWQGALDYVKCLNNENYLGHNDWRLPNRKELYSLGDYSKYNSVIPSGHPFTNVQSNYYWSSSAGAPHAGYAWLVYMYNGYVASYGKGTNYYVWPVRGGQASNSVISINSDAAYANTQNVTLALFATDANGVSQMSFSNDNSSWSTAETYATTKSYSLPSGDGTKTVYVKFKDAAGNESSAYSDSIILDTTLPTTTPSAPGGAYNASQSITLTAGEGGTIYYTTNGSTPTTSSSVYSSPISITSTTTLQYFAKDLAGNEGSVATAVYTIDTTAPTGTITINSGATYTNTTSVTLTLSCTDTNNCSQMQFSNDNIDWSAAAVAYATSKSYSLPSGDGTKTVYVKFKDSAGNWSSAYSYSAILDTTLPIGGAQIALPKTGQTLCYDSAGTVISCSGTGQDGEIQAGAVWPSPRFVADASNSNIIQDKLTGLEWAKDAGVPTVGSCTGGTKTWQGALDYVACLNTNNYLGHNDWRLPNILELESLVDLSKSNPALPAGHPLTNVQSNSYWSSSTYAYNTGNAWHVNMFHGYAYDGAKSAGFYVWPVRSASPAGGQGQGGGDIQLYKTGQTVSYAAGDDGDLEKGAVWPSPRFTDNGNGTATDNLTGLVWLKNANCFGTKVWSDAIISANGLKNGDCGLTDGSSAGDWRLPNRKELFSLVDLSKSNPALAAGHPLTNVQSIYYWLSSTVANFAGNAWNVHMRNGDVNNDGKSSSNYVWPVRGGQASNSVISINSDAAYANTQNVTLALFATDANGVSQMSFSNDNSSWSTAETYATTKSYSLPSGDGTKTVYVKFKDAAGNESSAYSDSIILDTTLPTTTPSAPGGAYNASQSITLTAGEGGTIYYTTNGSTPTTSSSVYSSPISITSTTTLQYFAKDLAGNEGSVATAVYTIDTAAPTGTITINSGATYTTSASVTLTLSCADTNACSQMQFSNDNIDWSAAAVAYATSKSYSLPSGDGTKTVYVKFKDSAGNWSSVYSDTIVLDTTAPTATPSVSGGTYTSAQSISLSSEAGATIYYTTDGTDPTTSGTRVQYAGTPISIASTTTLKYYTVDAAGNPETVNTQTYTINYPLTVTKFGTGTGTVTSNPSGINCGSDCSENYTSGTSVTLTAVADASSTFSGWSVACTGTGTCMVTMDVSKNVTALFDPTPNLTSGLVAWYPFSGNANDKSGNGNNGTNNGATLTTDRFGNANGAYAFDGVNSSITVNDSASLHLTDAATLAVWFKMSQWPPSSGYHSYPLICKGGVRDTLYPQYCLWMLPDAGNEPPANITFLANSVDYTLNSAISGVQLNEWHHYAASFDRGTVKIYLDGILKKSGTISVTSLNISNNPLNIGKWETGSDYHDTNGSMDDVRIYNRAFSLAEVQALYHDTYPLMGGSIQGTPINVEPALVSTLAGTAGAVGSTDGTGTAARFSRPIGVTTDGTNLFVADADNHAIRKIVISTGAVTTFAGSFGVPGSADGTGTTARFNLPVGITTDGTNLYVCDAQNYTIRKIVIANGAVTTLAGSVGLKGSTDGFGTTARFGDLVGITTDGTNLYVVDYVTNNTIRKVVIATGEVTTFAGTAGNTGSLDGTGAAAQFNSPTGITTDGTNLYVADQWNQTIRKIVIASGAVTTLAGSTGGRAWADGTGTSARFNLPREITTDGANLYVTDSDNHVIRKVVIATGAVTTLAGGAGTAGSTDGTGTAARFAAPWGITTDGTNLYVAEYGNHTIRKITAATAPGTPTNVTATVDNGQATVSFTAPASNGGSAITGYTVTASPGNITATGTGTSIIVTGLTNGTAYTFTVTATNAAGASAVSSSSGSITLEGLTVTKSGTGTGSVTANTGTVTWSGSTGTTTYNVNTSVTLTATPASGSVFSGWSGACTGTGTCTLTMDAAKSVTALFDPTPNLTSGLVAWYPFSGNANDKSGNDHNGTVNGATLTTDRFGNVNGAYSFDGASNYINTSNAFVNFGMPSYTITTWFKISNLSKPNNTILNSLPSPEIVISYNHDFSNNRLSYWLSSSLTKNIIWTPSGLQGSKTDYTADTWYQLTAVKNNNSYTFYVNSVLDASIQTNDTFDLPDASLYFGSASFIGEYLSGSLDDVRIYNRALSLAEVQALYHDTYPLLGGSIQGTPINVEPALVSTLAGTAGVAGSTNGTGAAARFNSLAGITTDGKNLYVAEQGNQTIRKVVIATGAVTTFAGSAGLAGSSDGTGTAVRFNGPAYITTDGTNLYVADFSNHAIRKVVIATGAVTTFAGSAGLAGSSDGTGTAARFNGPQGITTDGINLYVTDNSNHAIRKVVIATGAVTTFAGSAGLAGSSDGTGTAARFNYPQGITTDGTNLYVADGLSRTIRRVVIATGAVTTLAGSAGLAGSSDGTGTAARFGYIIGDVTTDGTNLYVADIFNNTIRKVVIATGLVTTIAGSAGASGSTDGIGTAAQFAHPTGITTDGTNVYVTDSVSQTIRKIEQVNSYILSLTKSGTGTGTVTANPGTISWSGNTGTASYTSGSSVTLTAAASSGSTFTGWSGACSGTGTCTVTMDASKNITATFNLSDTTPPTGTIGITGGAASTNSQSVTVTLSATDATGVAKMAFSFDGTNWTVEEASANTKTLTMPSGDGQKTIYVKFKDTVGNWSNPYNTTINLDTTGPTVTATPQGGTFIAAQSVTLAPNESATIYYTVDGSAPTQGSASTLTYASAIPVSATTTLKFFAKDALGNVGAVKTETYTIQDFTVTANNMKIVKGDTRQASITFTAVSGFNSSVALSHQFVGGAPAGVTVTLDPLTILPVSGGANVALQCAVSSSASPGTYILRITATGGGITKTKDVQITIYGAMTIVTDTLPSGVKGQTYSATIELSGGVSPFTYTKTAGALPDGLMLNSDGTITGTPTARGSFVFTIQAQDSDNHTSTKEYSVRVYDPSYRQLVLEAASWSAEKSTASQPTASDWITAKVVDDYGQPVNVTTNTQINLTSSSTTGKFSIDGLAFTSTNSYRPTISAGFGSVDFQCRDTTSGTFTLTVSGISSQPSAGWQPASHSISIILPSLKTAVLTVTSVTQNAYYSQGVTVAGTLKDAITNTPLNGKAVYISFTYPSGNVSSEYTSYTNSSGQFSQTVDSTVIDTAGSWIAKATFKNDPAGEYNDTFATSPFTIAKADTSLTFVTNAGSISPTGSLTVSGKLSANTFVPVSLNGIDITIELLEPNGTSIHTVTATTYDTLGHFQAIINFNQYEESVGMWKVNVALAGTTNLNNSESAFSKDLNVASSAGYAILIQGDLGSQYRENYAISLDDIYNKLLSRGFKTDNIYYLTYPGTTHIGISVTGNTTKQGIQAAITQWAYNRMASGGVAPLYIVMIDHGSYEKFHIDPDYITPEEFNTWISALENNVQSGLGKSLTTVIANATCYSGSFIKKLSKVGRIIVTSSEENELSAQFPATKATYGDHFLYWLFHYLANEGETFLNAFHKAASLTHQYRCADDFSCNTNSINSKNKTVQHPLLDDNGDGVGSWMNVKGQEDGTVSSKLVLGVGTSPAILSIKELTPTLMLKPGDPPPSVYVKTSDSSNTSASWIEVKKPSFTASDTGGTGQVLINLPRVDGIYNESAGRWEFNISSHLTETGRYTLRYYAANKPENTSYDPDITPPSIGTVYMDTADNRAPSTPTLVSPANNIEVSDGMMVFRWNEVADPDSDPVTYTLRLYENNNGSKGAEIKKYELIPQGALSMDATKEKRNDGVSQLFNSNSYYWWEVTAIDNKGASSSAATAFKFKVTFTNAAGGIVTGIIYSDADYSKIVGASISLAGVGSTVSLNNGAFMIAVPSSTATSGSFSLTISAGGYQSTVNAFTISPGEIKAVNLALLSSDTIAPATMASPAGNTFNAAQSVTLSCVDTGGSGCATTYYTLDGSTPTTSSTAYTGPIAVSVSSTLKFFSKDSTGNSEETKSETYTIDTTPPSGTISSNSGVKYTNGPTVALTLFSSDAVQMQFSADGTNWMPPEAYAAAKAWTLSSGEGLKTIYVKFKDAAGNWSSPFSARITLDTTPPSLTLSTLPDGSWTRNDTLNITGTLSDMNGVDTITINGVTAILGANGSFSQAITLSPGANTITTVAKDAAGNTKTDTRTINFDQSAPNITLTSPADNSKTKQSTIEVSGSTDEAATITVKVKANYMNPTLNANAFTTPVTLTYGTNTIEITAVDPAGNTSTIKRTVIFDNENPSLSITEPNQDITVNQNTITLRGEVADLTIPAVTITMDNNTFTPVVTNGKFEQTLSLTSEKTYQITVKAVDELGYETVVLRNIIYDTTAPVIYINPITTPTNNSSQKISGTMEEGMTLIITSAAQVSAVVYPTNTTWETTVSNLTEGQNEISITSTDKANNTVTKKINILYDAVPPEDGALSASGANSEVTLTWSGFRDTTSGINVYMLLSSQTNYPESCAEGTTVNPSSYTVNNLTNGVTYYFRLCATDKAGNTSTGMTAKATPLPDTFTVNITKSGSGTITSSPFGIDCGAVCTASFGRGTSTTLTAMPDEGSVFAGWSGGCSGLDCSLTIDGPKSATALFSDNTAPTGSITINNGALYNNNPAVTLVLYASDANGTTHMKFSNNNITWSQEEPYLTTKAWTLSPSDGAKTVYVKFKDAAGNWSNAFSDSISLDSTPPATSASPAGNVYPSLQTITLTCNDGNGSGCEATYYTTDGTEPTKASTLYTGSIPISVSATLKFRSFDLAGNLEPVRTETYVITAGSSDSSTLALKVGWNFMSIPKEPSNTAIAEVLRDVSPNVRIVWGYDNQNKVWLQYKPGSQFTVHSSLQSIEAGKGYWIYMDRPAILSIVGESANLPATQLYAGWNLIGYSGEEAEVTGALNGIAGKWIIVWGWENGQWYAKEAPNLKAMVNVPELTTLNKGKAYWIKMNAPGSWQQ